MGLFNFFKKKESSAPAQNTANSVYTLKFAIPFFSVFDKTDPKLKAFPVKIAVGGSVQYRILDLDLCFNNIPLGKMSPEQLEAHVKDSLVSSVKHFINTIDYLPLLQFETELMAINDAAKEYLVPRFADEYGISLRTFNISRITYEEDDPNYQRLYNASASMANLQNKQALEDQNLDYEHSKRVRSYKEDDELHELERRKKLRNLEDDEEYESLLHKKHLRDMDREDEIEEHNHDRRRRGIEKEEELIDREDALNVRRQATEHELHRNRTRLEKEEEIDKIDLERKRRELDEEMYARRKMTDAGASLAGKLGQGSTPKLGHSSRPSLRPKTGNDDLDLGSL